MLNYMRKPCRYSVGFTILTTYTLSRDANAKNQSEKTQFVNYIHWSISHLLLRQQQLTFNTFPSTLKFSREKGRNKKKYDPKWVL